MSTTPVRMNSLEIYEESGRKAGTAQRLRDQRLASFHFQWLSRALALEHANYRPLARQTFNAAYKKAFNKQ